MKDKEQTLFERLDANFAEFQKKWDAQSKYELICDSTAITAVRDAHEYLTHNHGFELEEIDYLLLFENPLEIVADKWQERMEDLSDLGFALSEVFDKRDALKDYALKAADKRPSVLEKLRSASNLTAAKNAAWDKEAEL